MGNEQGKEEGDGEKLLTADDGKTRKPSIKDDAKSAQLASTPGKSGQSNEGHDDATDGGNTDENTNYFNAKLRQTMAIVSTLKNASDEDCAVDEFTNDEGHKIHTFQWKPRMKIGGKKMRFPGGPKGLIFILHGAGEHCQWYDPMARVFSAQGFMVCAHDHVGHGLSEGDRVHIDEFSQYSDDVVQHVNIMRKKYPECPVFLLGHSMGGAIALQTGLDHRNLQIAGMVLIGPAIIPSQDAVTPIKLILARMVAAFRPQTEISPIDPNFVSRDPKIVQGYIDDPLVWHGGLKARWAVSFIDTLAELQTRLDKVKWPFLLMHGGQDKLCEISGSNLLHQAASSSDKTYKVYEDAYHQLHNEPDGLGSEVIQEISNWFLKHV